MVKCHASSIENFSEDSNTQDSLNSTGATSPVVRHGRGRGGFRGRWAHLKHNAQTRRKNKLKEVSRSFFIHNWEFWGGGMREEEFMYVYFLSLLRVLKF